MCGIFLVCFSNRLIILVSIITMVSFIFPWKHLKTRPIPCYFAHRIFLKAIVLLGFGNLKFFWITSQQSQINSSACSSFWWYSVFPNRDLTIIRVHFPVILCFATTIQIYLAIWAKQSYNMIHETMYAFVTIGLGRFFSLYMGGLAGWYCLLYIFAYVYMPPPLYPRCNPKQPVGVVGDYNKKHLELIQVSCSVSIKFLTQRRAHIIASS